MNTRTFILALTLCASAHAKVYTMPEITITAPTANRVHKLVHAAPSPTARQQLNVGQCVQKRVRTDGSGIIEYMPIPGCKKK